MTTKSLSFTAVVDGSNAAATATAASSAVKPTDDTSDKLSRRPPPPPAQPPAKSPSPPASTCRRLSYESAQTRSNTRTSSRSCSTPQPASSMHAATGLRPTLQVHSPLTAASQRSNGHALPASTPLKAPVVEKSPASPPAVVPQGGLKRKATSTPDVVPDGSAPSSPSPAAAAAPSTAAPCTTYANNADGADAVHQPPLDTTPLFSDVAHEPATNPISSSDQHESVPIPSSVEKPVTELGSSPPPPPKHIHGATATTLATNHAAAHTPPPPPSKSSQTSSPQSHGRPGAARSPQQLRRSHSANVGGVGGLRASRAVQPPPSLRSGLAGPSPFAAEQLAMPRRPSPASGAGTRPSPPPPPPPQVQLGRPVGLYRHNHQPSATTMAASQLPGAATAHDRLQAPPKSRLVRTASNASDSGARRRTPSSSSAMPSSPFKRRSSSLSGVARQRVANAATTTTTVASNNGSSASAAPQPRQHTPFGTFAFYTTRGGNGGGDGTAVAATGGSALASQPSFRKPGVPRSNSAPARRRTATATTATATVEAAIPTAIRPLSSPSHRLHASPVKPNSNTSGDGSNSSTTAAGARQRATHATRVTPASSAAPLGNGSPKVSRASSSLSTAKASREPSRLAERHVRPSVASGALTRRTAVTSGGGIGGTTTTRPMISATAGGATHRARPVVSTSKSATGSAAVASPSRPSAAAVCRPRADRSKASVATTNTSNTRTARGRHDSGGNAVSAAQSSMITIEESKEFLQEFQRMNQRELALFGTLLTTVANEQQQHRAKQSPPQVEETTVSTPATSAITAAAAVESTADQPLRGRQEKPAESTAIAVQSADEVSVWTCKRPSLEQPLQQPQPIQDVVSAGNLVHANHPEAPGIVAVTSPPPPLSEEAKEEEETVAATEVVVLVRRSCSRAAPSTTPSPTRRLDLVDAHEQPPRSPSPTPNAPANPRTGVLPRVDPYARHSDERVPHDRTAPSPSPSPTSPPVQSENVPQNRAAAPATDPDPRKSAAGGGALQPRNVNDANAKAATVIGFNGSSSGGGVAHRKSHLSTRDVGTQRSSTSLHSSQSRRRRRRHAGLGGGNGGGNGGGVEAPTNLHAHVSPDPASRQRSVTSYADMRSYSRSEDRSNVPEYSPDGAANDRGVTSTAPEKGTAPPLAALRRAKELAAEQAAALVQRQRERQQQQQLMRDNAEMENDASVSYASPSMFSSCGSPSGSSMGRPSSAVGGVASEVAEVHMSAAQLQLLIDGSRSRPNWERYQQL